MPDSIAAMLAEATDTLANMADHPRLEAELLLAHCLGLERSTLYAHPERALAPEQLATCRELVAERATGQPLAYLTGEKEFWSMALKVTPDTLVPRPETELLVELSLAHVPPHARIAELGTGSGAIAIALARELPDTSILATDASAAALKIAKENALRHGIDRIDFVEGAKDDWYAPLADRRFDLVVANPPYVAANDPAFDSGEIRFEPRDALAAGDDGLDALRAIIAGAPAHLAKGGWILLEHGATQGRAVRELMYEAGIAAVETWDDLAGLERATIGRLPYPPAATF